MKTIFKNFLFTKHVLVNDSNQKGEDCLECVFSFANLLGIKIIKGLELANLDLIKYSSKMLGQNIPDPFYKGFPNSVKQLTKDELLFDQLMHYRYTYGYQHFDNPGHSLLEELYKRIPFKENITIKEFIILKEEDAVNELKIFVDDLLASTRPLSDSQYQLVQNFINEYKYCVENIASKNTAIRLLINTRNEYYVRFLNLSDVIKVVDQLNYELYRNENVKKLNLKNKDRKFITKIIDILFEQGQCNIKECFEKRKIWCGLLHHIHYKPSNDMAKEFLSLVRSGKNISAYAEFEKSMLDYNIKEAVDCLVRNKGSGSLLRHLNYILSRCYDDEDIEYVIKRINTKNPIILIQLLLSFNHIQTHRVFKFTKYNRLKVHIETYKEIHKRRSRLSRKLVDILTVKIYENLSEIYKSKINKIYIDEKFKKIALPLQENTSMGGLGVLPKGSRLAIEKGKKVRAFTYWEKVNDIDLSAIGITKNGRQKEFSWRTMFSNQSDVITFSGDQTSGYFGGSEYFDINLDLFKESYSDIDYLVFCNNVYSNSTFNNCFCKAGYMLRDSNDSGEIYEPKTVDSSFVINCDSTFAYLFAIDLNKKELVWLNVSKDSNQHVAGVSSLNFLFDYLDVTNTINVYKLFEMMANELVDNPMDADVVVSDENVEVREDTIVIHSYDFEKILSYMNNKSL